MLSRTQNFATWLVKKYSCLDLILKNHLVRQLCQHWFFNDCGAFIKGTMTFQKLLLFQLPILYPNLRLQLLVNNVSNEGLWKNWWNFGDWGKKILESKAVILVSGCLTKYNYKAGETIMNKYDGCTNLCTYTNCSKQEIWLSLRKKEIEPLWQCMITTFVNIKLCYSNVKEILIWWLMSDCIRKLYSHSLPLHS